MKNTAFILSFLGLTILITIGIVALLAGIGWFLLGWRAGIQFSNGIFMTGALIIGISIYSLFAPRRVSGSMIAIPSQRRSLSGTWAERMQGQALLIQAAVAGILMICISIIIDKIFD